MVIPEVKIKRKNKKLEGTSPHPILTHDQISIIVFHQTCIRPLLEE